MSANTQAIYEIVNKIEELIEGLMAYKESRSVEDSLFVRQTKIELEIMLRETIYSRTKDDRN